MPKFSSEKSFAPPQSTESPQEVFQPVDQKETSQFDTLLSAINVMTQKKESVRQLMNRLLANYRGLLDALKASREAREPFQTYVKEKIVDEKVMPLVREVYDEETKNWQNLPADKKKEVLKTIDEEAKREISQDPQAVKLQKTFRSEQVDVLKARSDMLALRGGRKGTAQETAAGSTEEGLIQQQFPEIITDWLPKVTKGMLPTKTLKGGTQTMTVTQDRMKLPMAMQMYIDDLERQIDEKVDQREALPEVREARVRETLAAIQKNRKSLRGNKKTDEEGRIGTMYGERHDLAETHQQSLVRESDIALAEKLPRNGAEIVSEALVQHYRQVLEKTIQQVLEVDMQRARSDFRYRQVKPGAEWSERTLPVRIARDFARQKRDTFYAEHRMTIDKYNTAQQPQDQDREAVETYRQLQSEAERLSEAFEQLKPTKQER